MDEYQALTQIGLRRSSIACYKELYEHGPASAKELTVRLGKRSQSIVYESLHLLISRGFVTDYMDDLAGMVSLFSARPLENVLPEHYAWQRLLLNELIRVQQITPKR